MKFNDDKIYAECHNPGGFLALPVGDVWVKTAKWYSNVMSADTIYGYELNRLFEEYEDIIQIEFRSPQGVKILYRAY